MSKSKDNCDDFSSSSNCLCNLITTSWKRAKIFATGLLGLGLFVVLVISSLPVYLYRWLLVNIVTKHFSHLFPGGGNVASPVSPLGTIFALEFMDNLPPRNTIVGNFVVEGDIFDRDELRQLVQRRWIDSKEENAEGEGSGKELKYPELKQYIEYWMGFMFWKQDNDFHLDNHLIFHRVPGESGEEHGDGDATSERYVHDLMEDLLNKPYTPKRSPWEIHVVENYQDSQLGTTRTTTEVAMDLVHSNGSTKKMTAFILRFHHGLADGFSLLYAVIEGLCGLSISEISLAQPEEPPSANNPKPKEDTLMAFLKFPWKLIYGIGLFSVKAANNNPTPWHVPDKKKCWNQIYERSDLIPIEKLKQIKRKFGVSFTGALMSCLAAGVQKSLAKNGHGNVEKMPALSPLPLPGHPKKFQNHVTAAVFDLPTSSQLNSLERLLECEWKLQQAKRSGLPQFSSFYAQVIGSHTAPVAKLLLYNSVISLGVSNFPGPGHEIYWNGRKGVAAACVVGAVTGVAGVAFMVLSYRGYIRISVSAESAVMEREDVKELIGFVCHEIDKLHTLSSSSSSP